MSSSSATVSSWGNLTPPSQHFGKTVQQLGRERDVSRFLYIASSVDGSGENLNAVPITAPADWHLPWEGTWAAGFMERLWTWKTIATET